MKKIIPLILLLIVVLTIGRAQSSSFFNPFQYGIKAVKELKVINNDDFRNRVRDKAVELLNERYGTTSLFYVEDETIKRRDGGNVDEAVREEFGTWKNLLIEAADEVIAEADTSTLQSMGIDNSFKVVNLTIKQGKLDKIYVAPAKYRGTFPRILACEKGIGQCLLFIFDKALRILYTFSLAIGVIMLMLAGISYIVNPKATSETHKKFFWGIIGIIVSITSFTIVIVLERGLTGGLVSQVPSSAVLTEEEEEEEIISGGGTGTTTPSGGTPPKGKLTISDERIDEQNRFAAFVNSNADCNLKISFFNLTKRQNIISTLRTISAGYQFIEINLPSQLIVPNDEVRVVYDSSDCNIISSKMVTLRPISPPSPPPSVTIPEISITNVKMFGQLYLTVKIPDNLKNILEQIIRVGAVQRNLYNPPFTIQFTYKIKDPPRRRGSCTLYGRIRGVNVTNINFQNEVVSFRAFSQEFSVNLNVRTSEGPHNQTFYLYLPSQTIGFVLLEIYSYDGDCQLKDELVREDLLYSAIIDIESGKVYTRETGWEDILRSLFGL